MSRIDLNQLSLRESEQVEWKKGVADERKVVSTLVAFANDFGNFGGGYVVCGAEEAKDEHGFQKLKVVGLLSDDFKRIEKKVLALCRENVSPPLVPLIEELPGPTPDRRVLIFVVPATGQAHAHAPTTGAHGQYWIRMGSNTIEARNGLLRELLVRKGPLEPFDRRPGPRATIDDLDLVVLRDTLTRIKVWDATWGVDRFLDPDHQISPFVPSLTVREPMTDVVRPRNFALLLFGREPWRFFHAATTQFNIYPGVERDEPASESLLLAGTVIHQAERIIDLLNIQATEVHDKTHPTSQNIHKYPLRALKEAVVNALVHRDYEVASPTLVTVFLDRIEIVSHGGLLSSIKHEDFIRGRATPRWRNQSLSWIFRELDLAQASGQGIPTILRVMREAGCPPPVFELGEDEVRCTLPAHPRHGRMREIQEMERALAGGNLSEELQARVEELIARDPFDTRAVELLCELARQRGDLSRVLEFVERNDQDLGRFSRSSVILLGESLGRMEEDERARRLSVRLMDHAARMTLDEREFARVGFGLLRVGRATQLEQLLQELVERHPTWIQSPDILGLRGRMHLQLARDARERGLRGASPRFRFQAWEEVRQRLEAAEGDLREVLAHNPDLRILKGVQGDLARVEELRRAVKLRP